MDASLSHYFYFPNFGTSVRPIEILEDRTFISFIFSLLHRLFAFIRWFIFLSLVACFFSNV
jgi:hypothetical protein